MTEYYAIQNVGIAQVIFATPFEADLDLLQKLGFGTPTMSGFWRAFGTN